MWGATVFTTCSCALCVSAKAAKAATILMAWWGTYKWNFSNLKKSFRNLKISGFWHFCQIFKFPLLSTFTGHANCLDFLCFSVHCCADLCESTLVGKVAALCRTYKSTYCKSGACLKNHQNPEIYGILPLFSDFWDSTFKYPFRPIDLSLFLCARICFMLRSGWLGLIIPLQGLQVWNPNMKHTHTHRSCQPAGLLLVHWKSFLDLGRPD
jgi:hypothetical protein